ncbi:MAG TPA: hypothetical protein H9830_15865 [Candidatus Agrococcus pullicola]|uniref:Uncharacterized protein n=1 Tax=Candidatus Agrococcus pullicola TaxID=2838429 RepID=A0A9D2C9Y0_9MICO|nr:hypothetical protein [Candidatus Agrococcus pullicola]
MRFGFAVDRIDERIPGIDLPLMSVSQTRGVIRRSELTDKPHRADSLDVYKVCRRDDIVFNKMSIRSGAMGVAKEDGLVTYHYEVMRPREWVDSRFIAYLMKSHWFTGELIKRERGIGAGGQGNVRTTEVPFSVLKTIDSWIPDADGQRAIADFLDQETAQIDALVAKQLEFIGLLRERHMAEIGAGVEAELPNSRLRRHVKTIRQGWSPNAEPFPADGVTEWGILKVGCSTGGKFRPEENKKLPSEVAPRHEHVVKLGEIVMSRSNSRELVGSAAVVHQDHPRLMLSDLNYGLMVADSLDPNFAVYALMTRRARAELASRAKGTSPSMQKLAQRDVLDFPLWVPTIDEQRAITDHLDAQTHRIDTLIAKAEEHIALAKERRAALITAAVTGQFDVRTARKAG